MSIVLTSFLQIFTILLILWEPLCLLVNALGLHPFTTEWDFRLALYAQTGLLGKLMVFIDDKQLMSAFVFWLWERLNAENHRQTRRMVTANIWLRLEQLEIVFFSSFVFKKIFTENHKRCSLYDFTEKWGVVGQESDVRLLSSMQITIFLFFFSPDDSPKHVFCLKTWRRRL